MRTTWTALAFTGLALALPASAAAAIKFPDGDIAREAFAGTPVAVTWTTPTDSDEGPLAGPPDCTPAPGSAFGVGATTVHCSGQACLLGVSPCVPGPSTSGDFTVTITRGAGPVITGLPADRMLSADPLTGTATLSYSPPAASDPSGVAAGFPSCSPAPGSVLSVGTHTVTCTAKDSLGNASAASFAVVVVAPQLATKPTSAAPAPAQAALAARSAKVHGRFAYLTVRCTSPGGVPCAGAVALTAKHRRKAGSARFTAPPGAATELRVPLSRWARRTLARRHILRVTATLRSGADRTSRRLTLRRSRR